MSEGSFSPSRQTHHAWDETYARLAHADRAAPLAPDELERLAVAAFMSGRDAECDQALLRAFRLRVDAGDVQRAARCAFWIAFGHVNRGELAPASGWAGRGRRLLDEAGVDSVERGYLLLPVALQRTAAGDIEGALAAFVEASSFADRFGDADLAALARQGQGRVLIRRGETIDGAALLDEVMATVIGDDVSPIVAGTVYCSVISACHDMFDLRRAQEWTGAFERWCAHQGGLVAYQGQCLVRRSEIMQLRGAWTDAMADAQRACDRLGVPPGQPDAGGAFYQHAELHRLHGEAAAAEEAYQRANERGRSPQPGLALLRLAQGRGEVGLASIRGALDASRDPRARADLLPAFVEIALAMGDIPAARAAVGELSHVARDIGAPYLEAVSTQATGAVQLADQDPQTALTILRRALEQWGALDVPYETARTRTLIGVACRILGDAESAVLEFEAARSMFAELGAAPDLERLDALAAGPLRPSVQRLTAREVEVLRLVASGRTNRAIAETLHISEKTVARHVSNIFGKIGLSTRAAATAWCYEHGLK